MFAKKTTDVELELAIIRALKEIEDLSIESEEYAVAVDQITKLYKIKNASSDRVSADTLAIVAGNLLGIVLIVGHERAHVVTSKALSFILKAK